MTRPVTARIGGHVWIGLSTCAAVLALGLWLNAGERAQVTRRVPVKRDTARAPGPTKPRNPGTLVLGKGKPGRGTGSWPQFRGPDRTGVAPAGRPLNWSWSGGTPREVWAVPVGEGHAGAAIHSGRVFLVDYDRQKKEDAIRCLSLDDGREIWRHTYYVKVKRNHGMSRTVPAVNGSIVVALGPMCHVTCLDMHTGKLLWKKDLVKEYGTTVPPWYAGQCPLVDGDRVILAPGGDPLMMAVDGRTGKTVWRTPNPGGWGMTHASITKTEVDGQPMYVYPFTRGVVGVGVDDGRILWRKPDWRINIATIPSAVVVPPDRLFLSGGYNAGCAMVRLRASGDRVEVEELWRLAAEVFGSAQHTPVFYEGHLYGVAPDGQMACLNLSGKRLWASGPSRGFGLGPYFVADGKLVALNDQKGTLHVAEASAQSYQETASAKVLSGHDAWAPMALADGKLILRDLTRMVCLDLSRGE